MSPIKDFKLAYEALNQEGTFSAGDTVVGTLSFTLKDDTKVKKLLVKLKGEARVHWTEGTGDRRRTRSDFRRYFNVKECFVEENGKGNELSKGDHRYDFKLKIPEGDFPPSFKGFHGKITYMLEAKISRSWRMPSCEQKELRFVSKYFQIHGQTMFPNSGSVGKEVGVFSKGQVKLSASVDKKVCAPGEIVSVVGTACNSSSKETKVKFSLQKRIVYRAHGSTNISDQSLCKMAGNTMKENSEETVSCQIKIPQDADSTVHNCEIISVEYYVKVYLDISFAIDPEVKLPLVIVPLKFAGHQSGGAAGPYPGGAAGPYPSGAAGPYPGGAAGAPSYSDFPPPASGFGPYPVPAAPGAFGYPAQFPTQHPNTSGYNSQWPQPVPPFGFAGPAYPPPMGQPQAPTAPPAFQQGQPPTYTSLYPSTQDIYSGDKKY